MAESAQEWHRRTLDAISEDGLRPWDAAEFSTWPWESGGAVKSLAEPAREPDRAGAGGRDCFICAKVAAQDRSYIAWEDEVAILGMPHPGTPLPFLAFLMPKRHADLGDLDDEQAARMGVLLTHLERSVTSTLDVPRVQVNRWGDGTEHLHWWVYGRPTGVGQLRGTFLSMWNMLLPLRPQAEVRADVDAVVATLVEAVGGTAFPVGE